MPYRRLGAILLGALLVNGWIGCGADGIGDDTGQHATRTQAAQGDYAISRAFFPSSADRYSGRAVATLGEHLLVGEVGNLGTVNMFERRPDGSACETQVPVQTFRSPNPQAEAFGASIATHGGLVLVGAYRNSEIVANAGAAYLYDGDLGSPTFGDLLWKFDNPAPTGLDFFGWSLAFVGSKALIAADASDRVFLFDADPASVTFGDLLLTFVNPAPEGTANFGYSVAAIGDNVLIGDPSSADWEGAVYLYDGVTGELLHTFHPVPLPNAADCADFPHWPCPRGYDFGRSVTAVGSYVLVGATSTNDAIIDTGAAYLFDGDPASPTFGDLLGTFSNPFPDTFDQFGEQVLNVDGDVLVSAYYDDIAGVEGAGAAYLFDGDPASPTFGALEASFVNPTPGWYDRFGAGLATAGGDIIITAPYDGTVAPNSGAVYVFRSDPFVRDLCIRVSPSMPVYNQPGVRPYVSVSAWDAARAPVAGAAVHFVMTTPTGRIRTFDETTDAYGTAWFNYKVNRKQDGVGTYRVEATVTLDGFTTATGSTTFRVE